MTKKLNDAVSQFNYLKIANDIVILSITLIFLVTVYSKHFIVIFVRHVKDYGTLDLTIQQNKQTVQKSLDPKNFHHLTESFSCALQD